MVLSISFEPTDGIVKIENRALPPVNYGTALAIKLSPDEAGKLGQALLGYANDKAAVACSSCPPPPIAESLAPRFVARPTALRGWQELWNNSAPRRPETARAQARRRRRR